MTYVSRKFKALIFCLLTFLFFTPVYADYSQHLRAGAIIDELVSKYEFTEAEAKEALKLANTEQRILDSMANAAEKTRTWKKYRESFLVRARIVQGKKFMREHHEQLQRVEQKYGVPAHIVTAILGVETNYGGYTGKANVLDALATLAFEHPRRGKFFSQELTEFIVLARDRGWPFDGMQGSYAGAMGMAQFMPSNYRRLAVDGNDDGVVDLFNADDAIESVAHYFVHHGWVSGEPVTFALDASHDFDESLIGKAIKPNSTVGEIFASGFSLQESTINVEVLESDTPARVIRFNDADGDEFWLGLQNFYVISRYNPRTKYAMAVYLLSQKLIR